MGPLECEYVLRVLRAPAFTRQLAGVKLLRDLVYGAFYGGGEPERVEVGSVAGGRLAAWLG